MDFWHGMALGFSLIIAIGSQNAFVLKQGLKQQHVFAICLFCAISDAVLIAAGVLGFGTITMRYPSIIDIAKYAGAVFLAVYGILSLYASVSKRHALAVDSDRVHSLKTALLLCVGFTWLNPHVYLDTLVLVGMVSTGATSKLLFALGAMLASVLFFFTLGYGAKLLTPVFTNPKSWNVLDAVVGVTMLLLAWQLLLP